MVIKPLSIPKFSFNTLAIGAIQFVVHDAAEITLSVDFKFLWFTPKIILVAFLHGAETSTFFAPELICSSDFSFVLNFPVHSKTISTLCFFQSILEISFSFMIAIFLPFISIDWLEWFI